MTTPARTRAYLIHALSPIHCGVGQSTSGIDLPVARERHTGMPIVPGSSLKGVLRGLSHSELTAAVFGPDTVNASDHAGCMQFGDATLAFLPVRSIRGTFAWVTSPVLLRRLLGALREAGLEVEGLEVAPTESQAVVAPAAEQCLLVDKAKLVFEDFDFGATFSVKLDPLLDRFARALFTEPSDREFFKARVAVVHDDVMAVLSETALEVTARNSVDPETGTVRRGALWTEESLPTETVLVGRLVATPVKVGDRAPEPKALFDHVEGLLAGPIQVGGHANIGRGLCRVALLGGV